MVSGSKKRSWPSGNTQTYADLAQGTLIFGPSAIHSSEKCIYQCDLYRLKIIGNLILLCIHLFIHSIRYFKRYLLNILTSRHCSPCWDIAVNKIGRNYCPQENSYCTILNASGIAKKKE